MRTELGHQRVIGILAVQHIGPPPTNRPTEHLGVPSTANGSGLRASNARASATNSAVDPTLVVMSQASPSERMSATLRPHPAATRIRRASLNFSGVAGVVPHPL
jgi:hypothetical protein